MKLSLVVRTDRLSTGPNDVLIHPRQHLVYSIITRDRDDPGIRGSYLQSALKPSSGTKRRLWKLNLRRCCDTSDKLREIDLLNLKKTMRQKLRTCRKNETQLFPTSKKWPPK